MGYALVLTLRKYSSKEKKMTISLILKVVAMAIGIVNVVLGFFPKETTVKTHITMLSIGLAALAIAAFM
jgi:uncharacterized membrane protein